MASQKEVLEQIQAWANKNPGLNPFDAVRKEKIQALKDLTGRPVMIYASDFISPKLMMYPQLQSQVTISLRDKDYLTDIVKDIPGDAVDFFIQSPGGSAEAVETMVSFLRSRFANIRVLIPGTAKSAATMLAMVADQIIMDDLSEMGPTDPQMVFNNRFNPAGAILKQFQLAAETLKKDAGLLSAWLPILQMYGPSLLIECQHHIDLSRKLVAQWLQTYMFANDPPAEAEKKAREIAEWLSEDDNFLTHSRRVGVNLLHDKGVNVLDMATDVPLQHAVREVYYALMSTFDSAQSYKLFENSEGVTLSLNASIQVASGAPKDQPKPANQPQPPPMQSRAGGKRRRRRHR